jgi:hypothetical protein
MPERTDAGEIHSGKISKPEQPRWERLPKKGTRVSLPLRTDRDTNQQLESTKRPRISHFQHVIAASASELPLKHTETKDERHDNDEQVVRPRALALRRSSTTGATQYERYNPLLDSRNGARPKVRHPQDHGRLHLLNNSPLVPLGSGGRDPFSTLPSDLPKAFLDEHLQTSKCPKISIHVSRTTRSFYIGDRHWIC